MDTAPRYLHDDFPWPMGMSIAVELGLGGVVGTDWLCALVDGLALYVCVNTRCAPRQCFTVEVEHRMTGQLITREHVNHDDVVTVCRDSLREMLGA